MPKSSRVLKVNDDEQATPPGIPSGRTRTTASGHVANGLADSPSGNRDSAPTSAPPNIRRQRMPFEQPAAPALSIGTTEGATKE